MTFLLRDNIICAGKYVMNVDTNDRCTLNLLSSSDNVQTPACDAKGNDVVFNVAAMDELEMAVRKRWTYVDLRKYQE